MRAYSEINDFEEQLARNNTVVVKYWLQISKAEQLKRFRGREKTSFKRFKITDEERAQPYLWRFWRHVPHHDKAVIFDRSWYGRVLVERVEGFAPVADWSRAYHEINEFEEQLADHGIVVNKFWIHISLDEQLRRFRERQKISYKRYKITEEDWRNRKRWEPYKMAVNDMVARCSTKFAPWTLVAGNDKKFARVQIVKTIVRRLEEAL